MMGGREVPALWNNGRRIVGVQPFETLKAAIAVDLGGWRLARADRGSACSAGKAARGMVEALS